MKVFIDTNVLATILLKEAPRMRACAAVVSLSNNSKFQVFTSAITLATCFYFAEKKYGKEAAKSKLRLVVDNLKVARCDEDEAKNAFTLPVVSDFEDGLQYFAAVREGCKAIITYDFNGFHYSKIPLYTPEDFLQSLL